MHYITCTACHAKGLDRLLSEMREEVNGEVSEKVTEVSGR